MMESVVKALNIFNVPRKYSSRYLELEFNLLNKRMKQEFSERTNRHTKYEGTDYQIIVF
jgi:hypothetical protein